MIEDRTQGPASPQMTCARPETPQALPPALSPDLPPDRESRGGNRARRALELLDREPLRDKDLQALKMLYGLENPEPEVCDRIAAKVIAILEEWRRTRNHGAIESAWDCLALML